MILWSIVGFAVVAHELTMILFKFLSKEIKLHLTPTLTSLLTVANDIVQTVKIFVFSIFGLVFVSDDEEVIFVSVVV